MFPPVTVRNDPSSLFLLSFFSGIFLSRELMLAIPPSWKHVPFSVNWARRRIAPGTALPLGAPPTVLCLADFFVPFLRSILVEHSFQLLRVVEQGTNPGNRRPFATLSLPMMSWTAMFPFCSGKIPSSDVPFGLFFPPRTPPFSFHFTEF